MAVETVNWTRKDYHVHESHSADALEATVERYCRVAEARGIDEVCFTTHFIITGPDVDHGVSPDLIGDYMDEIHSAQEDTEVSLRFGLEVDYFPGFERQIEIILDEYPFDFILGSLHYINGIDIGSRRNSPRFFKGRPIEESLTIYYEGWRKAVESGLFDVMAHPDYFRKYLHLSNIDDPHWEQYGASIHDAFSSLKKYNVGVEVNSSGYRHGINDVYPIFDFVKALKEAGVDLVTIGSDTHSVYSLGSNTLKCAERLEKAGYDYTCVYKGRKSRKVSLSEILI